MNLCPLRAQKAYRERQKAKLTDSEEQMKTLTAHLESLVQENGKLQSRIALMVQSIRLSQEKVVQVLVSLDDEDDNAALPFCWTSMPDTLTSYAF